MFDDFMDKILRTLIHNGQSDTRSIVYNAVEQVMLDMLCKEVIGERLDKHKAKLFDTDTEAQGLSNRLLTLSSWRLLRRSLGVNSIRQ